jgi:hypothetical protein
VKTALAATAPMPQPPRLELVVNPPIPAHQLRFARAAEGPRVLPQVLYEAPGVTVKLGSDAGDFYCEHALFVALRTAAAPDSVVGVNDFGERLVGFLHVPVDAQTEGRGPPASPAERHRGTREIVALALRGYFDAAKSNADSVRILLTGYGQWGNVVDNPTGAFVKDSANIDAAVRLAFGKDLVGALGAPIDGAHTYLVRDGRTRMMRELVVHARAFDVADSTIDGGPRSLQAAMREVQPHAVLSMGVRWIQTHEAEVHADDGGLSLTTGAPAHDGSIAPSVKIENSSLGRAIRAGAEATTTIAPDALPPVV